MLFRLFLILAFASILWAFHPKQIPLKAKFGKPHSTLTSTPSSANCTMGWYDQRIDHLTSVEPPNGELTFKQKYYYYDDFTRGVKDPPIFFYTGNEGQVELYVNNTGLMWEFGEEIGALLIFVEHRYFGDSSPFGEEDENNLQYLSSEQALADYATFITTFKTTHHRFSNSPIVAFGGSYGGF